jgi:YD repeat-containing protein
MARRRIVGTVTSLCAVALSAAPALAQGSRLPASRSLPPWTACEQERLQGNVQSVTVWSGDVVHATRQETNGRFRVSSIAFSDDGRSATETEFHGPETNVSKYEFDASGKLTRVVLLDGSTPLLATECRYDGLGRVILSKSNMSNGGGEIQYSYAERLLTVRIVGSAAKTTILTYSLDSDHRPTQVIERDEATRARVGATRYEYKDGGRVTCNVSTAKAAESCTFARFDDHGHVVEEIFPSGRTSRDGFDYDFMGNWVTHVSDGGPSRDTVVWRDITYK